MFGHRTSKLRVLGLAKEKGHREKKSYLDKKNSSLLPEVMETPETVDGRHSMCYQNSLSESQEGEDDDDQEELKKWSKSCR
jgi:hypothetical protein